MGGIAAPAHWRRAGVASRGRSAMLAAELAGRARPLVSRAGPRVMVGPRGGGRGRA